MAQMTFDFLQVFCLATAAFSNIYTPNTHTALNNIYEITNYFLKYRDFEKLGPIVLPMEIKFLNYYKKN